MYISIFLTNVTHIIRDTDFPLFCSDSARKCLILPAECSPQKSLILLEILPAEFIQAYWGTKYGYGRRIYRSCFYDLLLV